MDQTAKKFREFERERTRRGQVVLDLLTADLDSETFDNRYPILKTITRGFYAKGVRDAFQVRIADETGQGDYEPVDLTEVFKDEISHVRIDNGSYYKVHNVEGPVRETRTWTIKCSATGESTPT